MIGRSAAWIADQGRIVADDENGLMAKLLEKSKLSQGHRVTEVNVDATSAFNLIGDPNSRGGLTNGVNGNIVGKFG